VSHCDADGISILVKAVSTRDLELVKLLLQHGADPLARQTRHLAWAMPQSGRAVTAAAEAGAVDILELLFSRIRPGKARDEVCVSALHDAATTGQLDSVRFLVERAHVDVQRGNDDSPGGVSLVSPNRGDFYTPLSRALSNDHEDVVRYLVARGARIEGRTNMGESPLVYAIKKGNNDLVLLFLDHKAPVNAPDVEGLTPLLAAVGAGNLEMTKLLLARGANGRPRTREGRTALHLAALGGHVEIISALLAAGASPLDRDEANKTPRDYAEAAGHPVAAEALAAAEKKPKPNPRK
jgi:ankyrin repeat protein